LITVFEVGNRLQLDLRRLSSGEQERVRRLSGSHNDILKDLRRTQIMMSESENINTDPAKQTTAAAAQTATPGTLKKKSLRGLLSHRGSIRTPEDRPTFFVEFSSEVCTLRKSCIRDQSFF
jgi:hypothetical protein